MKTRIFLLVLAVALFPSCKDLFRVDVETTLELTVPVEVISTAVALKSADNIASFSFSKTGVLSLSENEDLIDHIKKIKAITINSLNVSIFGLQSNQEIISLVISVGGAGTVVSLSNITPNTGYFTPDVSQTLLSQIADKLLDDQEITATISGTSNYAPMTFNVRLAFDTLVEAGIL